MPLLEIQNLQLEIDAPGQESVDIVRIDSLTIEPGEVLGIVGESGCGKSLSLRAIPRLLPAGVRAASGRILLNGRDLLAADESEMRRIRGTEIGMVFQEPLTALNPTMRVGDQIIEGPRRRGELDRRSARRRSIELLEMVGVPSPAVRAKQYPHELSGGMRQRVVIAMALASEPALLLCDEPTTALDATIERQVLDLLLELVDRLGIAMVMVTHDFGVVAATCARVAVMYAGTVVEEGPAAALLSEPQHPYTLALLQSVPGTNPNADLRAIAGMPPQPGSYPDGCRFHTRCPYVTPQCLVEQPALEPVGDKRKSACILAPGAKAEVMVS